MTWAAVVAWIIIVIGFLSRGPLLLYAFFAFVAFGTLDLVPFEAVAGRNMGATAFCGLFLIAKMLMNRDNAHRAMKAAVDPAYGAILSLFLVYSILSAYFLPRLFENAVQIIPVSFNGGEMDAQPLASTLANFTQPVYLTLSVAATFAFYAAAQNPKFRHQFLMATLFGGIVLIATGLVDMTASSLGLEGLLEPFRNNGNQSFDSNILDVRRVVGLMPEASSYGGTCANVAVVLCLLRACYPRPWRNWVVPPVVLGLVVMAALSTSSSAYAGLVALGAIFTFNLFRRAVDTQAVNADTVALDFYGLVVAVVAAALVILIAPRLLDPIYAVINEQIFQKQYSGSYIGRHFWTQTALDAFYATDGIGIGFGSARTSNYFIAVLSNVGVIGAFLLAAFIAQLFLYRCRGDKLDAEFMTAIKLSMLPNAVMLALAGTTADFGIQIAAQFGLILALASPARETSQQEFARPSLRSSTAGVELSSAAP